MKAGLVSHKKRRSCEAAPRAAIEAMPVVQPEPSQTPPGAGDGSSIAFLVLKVLVVLAIIVRGGLMMKKHAGWAHEGEVGRGAATSVDSGFVQLQILKKALVIMGEQAGQLRKRQKDLDRSFGRTISIAEKEMLKIVGNDPQKKKQVATLFEEMAEKVPKSKFALPKIMKNVYEGFRVRSSSSSTGISTGGKDGTSKMLDDCVLEVNTTVAIPLGAASITSEKFCKCLTELANPSPSCDMRPLRQIPQFVDETSAMNDKGGKLEASLPPRGMIDKLMLVAHADDETVFGAHLLISPDGEDPNRKGWIVVCATCDDPVRAANFRSAVRYSDAKNFPIVFGMRDRFINDWPIERRANLRHWLRVLHRRYDFIKVVAHNEEGEYGHSQHQALFLIASRFITKEGERRWNPITKRKELCPQFEVFDTFYKPENGLQVSSFDGHRLALMLGMIQMHPTQQHVMRHNYLLEYIFFQKTRKCTWKPDTKEIAECSDSTVHFDSP